MGQVGDDTVKVSMASECECEIRKGTYSTLRHMFARPSPAPVSSGTKTLQYLPLCALFLSLSSHTNTPLALHVIGLRYVCSLRLDGKERRTRKERPPSCIARVRASCCVLHLACCLDLQIFTHILTQIFLFKPRLSPPVLSDPRVYSATHPTCRKRSNP